MIRSISGVPMKTTAEFKEFLTETERVARAMSGLGCTEPLETVDYRPAERQCVDCGSTEDVYYLRCPWCEHQFQREQTQYRAGP